ncbi:MAG: acyl-CoA reductase, partial [Flavobacteriaceae bacterium]|nr:acyl-CoA reductase [Flavobacteriaceae bacterium]
MDRKVFETFVELGKELEKETLRVPYKSAQKNNHWFVKDSISNALLGVCHYLQEDKLRGWAERYPKPARRKKVGLITAGNIPLVGFHDILCTLITGHRLIIQSSSKDNVMTTWLLNKLVSINAELNRSISITKSLPKCDAYIA